MPAYAEDDSEWRQDTGWVVSTERFGDQVAMAVEKCGAGKHANQALNPAAPPAEVDAVINEPIVANTDTIISEI